MSFDLGVWHSEKAIKQPKAEQIYMSLCEDWPYLTGSHPNVAAFYRELTAAWPEIDTIAEERVGDFDYCPWSGELNHSGMAVVMSCVWSKAEDVAVRVTALAEKHSLVLYDPQAGKVLLPPHLLKPGRASFLKRLFGGAG